MILFRLFDKSKTPKKITLSTRKCLSGFQKRKLKKKQCDRTSKCKKLSNCLTLSSNSSTSSSPHIVETSHATSDETRDTVQTISISSNIQPTVDNCDTATSTNTDNQLCGQQGRAVKQDATQQKQETLIHLDDFIKYSDITNWHITCNNDFIQKCLMQNISFFSK